MSWLTGDTNHMEEQIEIFQELLNDKQEQLDNIENIEGNANIDAQKDDLKEQILHLKLNVEQAMEEAERAGREGETYEQENDLFDD